MGTTASSKMFKITLKAARVNIGLMQHEAAEKLGISRATLQNYENGITAPNNKTLVKICELYGVEYNQIQF